MKVSSFSTSSVLQVIGIFVVMVLTTLPTMADAALECGQPFTKDCNPDIRYQPNEFINLAEQSSSVWGRASGLYKVESFLFKNTSIPASELPESLLREIFPFVGYVNMTVQGTRYYYHATYFIRDIQRTENSFVIYREFFGHSTFEKDGTVSLMADFLQDANRYPRGQALPVEESNIQPMATAGANIQASARAGASNAGVAARPLYSSMVRRTRHFISVPTLLDTNDDGDDANSDDSSDVLVVYEKLSCPAGDEGFCREMTFTMEGFDKNNELVELVTGSYTNYRSASTYNEELLQAYETNQIPEDQRKDVPMTTECLIPELCYSEEDWCGHGDPSCGHEGRPSSVNEDGELTEGFPGSPYQHEDGELTKAVKAAISLGAILVFAAILYALYSMNAVYKKRRYRTLFAKRFVQDISLQKAMKQISPLNMSREFNSIDKSGKGFISKGEMYDFLLQSKAMKITANTTDAAVPVSMSDFELMWKAMGANGTGTRVSYLEFCMFTGDCYREHSLLRNKVITEQRKAAA